MKIGITRKDDWEKMTSLSVICQQLSALADFFHQLGAEINYDFLYMFTEKISYPSNSFFEPEKVEKPPPPPVVAPPSNIKPSSIPKPSFDRSTKVTFLQIIVDII